MKTPITSNPEFEEIQDEIDFWYALSVQGLARAYSDDEPEYCEEDLEPK
jgi:hypothetical protein